MTRANMFYCAYCAKFIPIYVKYISVLYSFLFYFHHAFVRGLHYKNTI